MNNQLKFGVLLSYCNIFIGLIVSIIYTPFMLRTIGENQYGLYTLVSSIVGYLGLLNFGFSASYMRHFSRYNAENKKESIDKLNGMFLVIFCLIGLIVFLIGVSIFPNLKYILGEKIVGKDLEVAKILFLVLVLNITIPLLTTTFNIFVIAHENFIFLKVITLVKTIVTPLLMIPILINGYGTIGMGVVTLIITLLFEVIISCYAIKKLKIGFFFRNFELNLLKDMFIFSSFIFLNMIIDQVNWSVDKLLIGRFTGTAAVAVYGIASQINSYYIMFSTQLSSIFIPRVNKLVAVGNNENVYELLTKVGRIQFTILCLILLGFYAFGEQFILLWVGDAYRGAYYIVLILISAVTIPSVQNIGIEIQRAKNMHKFRSIVYFFIAIGNVLISIHLVQRYGPVGAATGTAIALILGNGFIMNWYYHYYLKLNMLKFWTSIFHLSKGALIPMICAIIISKYIVLDNLFIYFATICVFCIIYGLSMWTFGLNIDEKKLFIQPLKKIVSKFS